MDNGRDSGHSGPVLLWNANGKKTTMALERTGPYDYLNPRREWLETTSEEILDPELPIVDAHHPIWAERGNNYQIDDFAEDLASGHNVISSVFAECHYSYFTDGPLELRPVGETKRISEIADSCDTPGMRTRVCEGIVGFADQRFRSARQAG